MKSPPVSSYVPHPWPPRVWLHGLFALFLSTTIQATSLFIMTTVRFIPTAKAS